MCVLNTFGSLTFVMLYIWSDISDDTDTITCTQWCMLPIVMLCLPFTIILDVIVLPIHLILFMYSSLRNICHSNIKNIQSIQTNTIDNPV